MKKRLAKYVMTDTDRHGNARHYYRRCGYKVRLRCVPETEDFAAELKAAEDYVDTIAPQQPNPAKPTEHDDGRFVYFVRYGTKKVKIGVAANVRARFSGLRVAIPGKARIYYVTTGGRSRERELHRLFREDRISGEWFLFSKAMREWIEADEARRIAARGAVGHFPSRWRVAPPREARRMKSRA